MGGHSERGEIVRGGDSKGDIVRGVYTEGEYTKGESSGHKGWRLMLPSPLTSKQKNHNFCFFSTYFKFMKICQQVQTTLHYSELQSK